MSRLRLDLIVRSYGRWNAETNPVEYDDRWTWQLWAGSRIVATSSSQLYSRRIDCAKGAEVGTGVSYVVEAVKGGIDYGSRAGELVRIRVIDERNKS